MQQKVDSPISVTIKYQSGRQITLGQDEAAQVLSMYMQHRKDTGDIIGEIGFVEPKLSIKQKTLKLIKNIDNYIYKLFTK